ncbi:MAG: EamA-like transporter [Paenibacillus sp.]|nr:EamA-like transporter [Paenibacillus sp.]
MGYVLLLLATLSWSFVGVLVKAASSIVDTTTITFLRFFIGIVFLGLFIWIRQRKLPLRLDLRWIWIGAIGKCCNYFFENWGLSLGYSYGNILVGPVQTVVLLFVSYLLFRDRLSPRGWAAVAMCLIGIVCISWNGKPIGQMFGDKGALITLFFVVSGIGAAFHVLSQKMLTKQMDSGSMNFSTFVVCSAMMAIPLPFRMEWSGEFAWWPVAALIILGLITGLSFYWFSQALRLISFPVAIIVSNSTVLFGILWSCLFYRDPITTYLVVGAAMFALGLIVLNWPARKPAITNRNNAASA